MSEFLSPLRKIAGNIIYTATGDVVCLYRLRGLNIAPQNPATALSASDSHAQLLKAMYSLPCKEVVISGLKGATDPATIYARMLRGLPQLPPNTSLEVAYPQYAANMAGFHADMVSGEITEFTRYYFLGVLLHEGSSNSEDVMVNLGMMRRDFDANADYYTNVEKLIYAAIPSEFRAQRTTSQQVAWLHDRSRTRGFVGPYLPLSSVDENIGVAGFADVTIDRNPKRRMDVDALLSRTQLTGKELAATKQGLFSRLASAYTETAIAVSSPATASSDTITSYQTGLVVSRYPTAPSTSINTFTYLVDQAIGLDADFSMRIVFDQEPLRIDNFRKFAHLLNTEQTTLAKDEYDARAYVGRDAEHKRFVSAVLAEQGAIGMRLTTNFIFASSNYRTLTTQVAKVRSNLEQQRFSVETPTGGQLSIYKSIMPCVPGSEIDRDMSQVTTVHNFCGMVPIRRTEVGDDYGIPIAINRENALGQIILYDILNATDRGNASIALTGAQGGGKSHLMKLILEYFITMKRYAHIIDNSDVGEYAVFLRDHPAADKQIVNLARGDVSLDPFKLYPDDPAYAQQVFVGIMLSLMDVRPSSSKATLLNDVCAPAYRTLRKIDSARDVVTHLQALANTGREYKELYESMRFWAQQPFAGCLFDPLDPETGRIMPTAPLRISPDVHVVLFRTHGLPLCIEGRPTPLNQFAQAVYTMIAQITSRRFHQIKGPCCFFGEEMSFINDANVLHDLIKAPDRTGRKSENSIVAAAQLASDFGAEFALIKQKFAFRQETRDNAVDSLVWLDVPPLDHLVSNFLDMSPKDEDTGRVKSGREGEGWFTDGSGMTVRIKALQQPNVIRRRLSDTTSSKMLRED